MMPYAAFARPPDASRWSGEEPRILIEVAGGVGAAPGFVVRFTHDLGTGSRARA